MNQPLRKTGQRLIVTGLVMQLGAAVAAKQLEHPSPAGLAAAIVVMLGAVVYIAGFAYFARAKARSAWWCLLGLLSLFGLTLLIALPDYDLD